MMQMTFPVLLCLLAGSMIFFLIGLYYIIKFSVRDGILEANKRIVPRDKDDRHV